SNLVRAAVAEDVGMVGGRVQAAPAKAVDARIGALGDLHGSGFDARPVQGSLDVDFVPGGNMGIWRSVLESTGGFDLRFTGTAWREETDVCVRVKQAGLRILFVPGADVEHVSARWTPAWQLRPAVQFSLAKNNGYF